MGFFDSYLDAIDPLGTLDGIRGKNKGKSPNYSATSSATNPFTTSTTTRSKNGRNTSTTVSLADDLQYMRDISGDTTNSAFDFLNLDPQQRVGWATSGQDPYYNLLTEQLRREEEEAAGRGMLRAQNTGNLNSTAYGSFLGRLGSDSAIRGQQNLLDTLSFQDNQARGNATLGMQALNNLYNYVTGGQGASMQGMGLLPDLGGQQYQANMLAQQQAQATKGALLNAGLSLAGYAIGGPLGGALGRGLGGANTAFTGTTAFTGSNPLGISIPTAESFRRYGGYA